MAASNSTGRASGAPVYIEEPPVSRWLFGSSSAGWIWLIARLWLGYEWLHAGWEKMTGPGRAAWMENGKALKGFAAGAIAASTEPEHPQVAYGWWVSFLNWVSDNAVWMGKLVAVGEVIIGIALILGLFTGIFAFLGVVLNFSFVFSGSAGVNPAFIIVGLLLVLAWRNAGLVRGGPLPAAQAGHALATRRAVHQGHDQDHLTTGGEGPAAAPRGPRACTGRAARPGTDGRCGGTGDGGCSAWR
jgi:thiosulfate dehydrogenase (quinone) large subunit